MKQPTAILRLRGDSRSYAPGDTLLGEYRLELPTPGNLRAVELSVLWYTEGKGEEDLGVHFFQRIVPETADALPLGEPTLFETVLPRSPLSYDGVIVRIHWCARVRLFLSRGRQVIAEQPFRLGNIPPARLVAAEEGEEPAKGDGDRPRE